MSEQTTWTYIGYVSFITRVINMVISHSGLQACRMAVELGLNRYVAHPSPHETEVQMRERRNRERTYLVLFVHDRSLTMQSGRLWMLPEVRFLHKNFSTF